jgi:transposase InsO family protein
VEAVSERLKVSERRICRVLGQPRSTQSYQPRVADDEEELTRRIVALATKYGRYGYRRVTALLKAEGWRLNHKIWSERSVSRKPICCLCLQES